MLPSNITKPLIVILGPTGVGKTEFSLRFAEHINGEIISADSRLFYRGMDIGTAKPTEKEMERVVHHLIDVCNPDENWSLALYQEAVNNIVCEIHNRTHVPILVGGTGQYIKAIVDGWDLPAQEPDDHLREILEEIAKEKGKQAIYKILTRMDPQTLTYVEYQNTRRVVRALEVIMRTGKPFSDLRQTRFVPYQIFQIGIKRDRKTLYERIDQRIEHMFVDGFVEEVKALIDQGYGKQVPALSAIGYREVSAYLAGEISMEEALTLMKRYTRQYVRRQANWFKETDPSIHWFDAEKITTKMVMEVIGEEKNWILPKK
ncbi:MAG: tRNA (adenosine(37)-N6)-dimethylallyltransferase MiaA [Anaerolineaceae bacterium]|nr:tRNA (adenosine(37)-N6)-dimethylallyltransferase MiaA [Anaerolineaceae bacterium]